LDPHYEQAACKLSGSFPDAQELQTYHQSQPLAIDIKSVDPGLAFGFYCRSPADLDDLWSRLVTFRTKGQGEPTFHLATSAPEGASNPGYSSRAILFDSDLGAAGSSEGSSWMTGGMSPSERNDGSNVAHSQRGNGEDEWELL
jgi:hypothetical protein